MYWRPHRNSRLAASRSHRNSIKAAIADPVRHGVGRLILDDRIGWRLLRGCRFGTHLLCGVYFGAGRGISFSYASLSTSDAAAREGGADELLLGPPIVGILSQRLGLRAGIGLLLLPVLIASIVVAGTLGRKTRALV